MGSIGSSSEAGVSHAGLMVVVRRCCAAACGGDSGAGRVRRRARSRAGSAAWWDRTVDSRLSSWHRARTPLFFDDIGCLRRASCARQVPRRRRSTWSTIGPARGCRRRQAVYREARSRRDADGVPPARLRVDRVARRRSGGRARHVLDRSARSSRNRSADRDASRTGIPAVRAAGTDARRAVAVPADLRRRLCRARAARRVVRLRADRAAWAAGLRANRGVARRAGAARGSAGRAGPRRHGAHARWGIGRAAVLAADRAVADPVRQADPGCSLRSSRPRPSALAPAAWCCFRARARRRRRRFVGVCCRRRC